MVDTGGSGGSPFEDVERWAAEARARDAAGARSRERWLRSQAGEEAALTGLLLDLAETGATVVVTTSGGRRHVGRVDAVGDDFAALRTAAERTTLVSLAAVVSVATGGKPVPASSRRSAGPREGGGGRAGPVRARVADVLGHAAGDRRRVLVQAGAVTVVGELVSVGTDLITVQADGDPPGAAYVRLASVSEVSLLDSG